MELTGLHAEIDRLQAVDPSADPAVLGAEIAEFERAINRLMAQKSRWLGAFDRVEGYLDGEQTSTRAWLRSQTLASHGQAAAEEHVARLRGTLPELHAAWDAGMTTRDHLRAVEVVFRRVPEEIWPEVDEAVTEHARVKTASEFTDWLRELAQSFDPTPKPRDETQHESRRLSLSKGYNGMTNVVGRLTPEVAEKLHAAISAASRPDAAGEVRLPNQRKADALDTVLDTVLDAGVLPTEGGQRPHLTVTVDLDQLSEAAQREEQRPKPSFWSLNLEERAARIEAAVAAADAAGRATSPRPRYYWTGPATSAAARRLACDGHLLPIFTRGGQPLDVGRHTRVVSASLRALVLARDHRCVWPDCPVAGRWTQVHHVVHWKDGDRTDRWNLLLLCPAHHSAAHDGRWTVVLHAPGRITVKRRLHPDAPFYEIRLKAPPPRQTIDLDRKLQAAAERARAMNLGQERHASLPAPSGVFLGRSSGSGPARRDQ